MPRRSKTRITEQTVRKKPQDSPFEIRDKDLRGFILRIQPTGTKTFYCEWAKGKRSRIGDAALMTVERAREIAEFRIADAKRGEVPKPQIRNKVPTLEIFLDDKYEEWAKSHQKAGAANTQRVRGAFPDLLDTRIDSFTKWTFDKWKMDRKKDGIAPSTINRDLAMIRAVLGKAVEWGEIGSHPMAGVKPLKLADHKRVRFLSDAEEKRLLDELSKREARIRKERLSANQWRAERGYDLYPEIGPDDFSDYLLPMVLVSMNTGIRYGELSNLRWPKVCLTDTPELIVHAAFSKSNESRHIPLNQTAKNTFTKWKSRQTDLGGYVFPGDQGGRIKSVRTGWGAVLEKAKIDDFKWHDLRHHFASKLVMAGVDLNTVRELLGHSSLDMTLRYAHLSPDKMATAVAKLDSA